MRAAASSVAQCSSLQELRIRVDIEVGDVPSAFYGELAPRRSKLRGAEYLTPFPQIGLFTDFVPQGYDTSELILSIVRSLTNPFLVLNNIERPALDLSLDRCFLETNADFDSIELSVRDPIRNYDSEWKSALQGGETNWTQADVEYWRFLDLWEFDGMKSACDHVKKHTWDPGDGKYIGARRPTFRRPFGQWRVTECCLPKNEMTDLLCDGREARDRGHVEKLKELIDLTRIYFNSCKDDTETFVDNAIEKLLDLKRRLKNDKERLQEV